MGTLLARPPSKRVSQPSPKGQQFNEAHSSLGDPPSPVEFHKTVRRKSLQPDLGWNPASNSEVGGGEGIVEGIVAG